MRIKAVLMLKRNATRNYIDFVPMQHRLGDAGPLKAMQSFDRLYPQPNGEPPTQQLLVQPAKPMPSDLEESRLSEYKRLAPDGMIGKPYAKPAPAARPGFLSASPNRLRNNRAVKIIPLPSRAPPQPLSSDSRFRLSHQAPGFRRPARPAAFSHSQE
jgi:hypothetical protein